MAASDVSLKIKVDTSSAIKPIQEVEKKIRKMGEITQDVASVMADAFENVGSELVTAFSEGKLNTIESTITTIQEILGGTLKTIINDSMPYIGEAVQNIIYWLKEYETLALVLASSLAILTAGIIAFNIWLKAGTIALGIKTLATKLWLAVLSAGEAITIAFGLATAFLSSTIGIVTIAIMAAVAVGIVLWKNWDFLKGFIVECWENIKFAALTIWEGIRLIISTAMEGIKLVISTILVIIFTIVQLAWEGIKLVISTTLTVISSIVQLAWEGIKLVISTTLTVISSIVQLAWEGIKLVISTILNIIITIVSTIWNGIQTIISTAVTSIKTIVSVGFNTLKNIVMGIWNGIGSGIQGIINGIIGCINGMVRAMNKINFTIPDWIPIMGGKSFGFNIPEISKISWFAAGGIIKGTLGGSLIGVGEAGDEAIIPLSNKGKMKPFARAVAGYMPTYESSMSHDTLLSGININVESLIVREEADIQKIAEQLFKIQERNRRARGKY